MQTQPQVGTVGVTVRLTPQTHEVMRIEAARRNVSLSLLVAQAIHEIASTKNPKRKPRKQPA